MTGIRLQDVIPSVDYERQREDIRARIIALKQRRRIAVGPLLTLVFENRQTVQFQVQEMLRAERIVDPGKIQDELDVYNPLLPSRDELSATLLIEITEEAKMKEWLDTFMGLDQGHKVALVAGPERAYGIFEGGHSHETKISAVHFIRFRPTPTMREMFADLRQPVRITVAHQGYQAEALVPGTLRDEWLKDLD